MQFIKQAAINEYLNILKLQQNLTDYELEYTWTSDKGRQVDRSWERFGMLCDFYDFFNLNKNTQGEIILKYFKPRKGGDGTLPDFI